MFGYENLNRAFAELEAGARLVCLHRNRWWQDLQGRSSTPGPTWPVSIRGGRRGRGGRQAGRRVLGGRPGRARSVACRGGDGRRRHRVRHRRRQACRAAGRARRTGKFREETLAAAELSRTGSSRPSRTPRVPRGAGVKVGLDLIEIERIREALERYPRFPERCFTDAERAYCDSARTRLSTTPPASPEGGGGQALGFGVAPFAWSEVEIAGRPKPAVRLSGRTRHGPEQVGAGEIDLSMTHSKGMAAAVAVVALLMADEPLYTAEEMRAAEAAYPGPTLELMERAGQSVADEILRWYPARGRSRSGAAPGRTAATASSSRGSTALAAGAVPWSGRRRRSAATRRRAFGRQRPAFLRRRARLRRTSSSTRSSGRGSRGRRGRSGRSHRRAERAGAVRWSRSTCRRASTPRPGRSQEPRSRRRRPSPSTRRRSVSPSRRAASTPAKSPSSTSGSSPGDSRIGREREILELVPRRTERDNKYSAGSVLVVGGSRG